MKNINIKIEPKELLKRILLLLVGLFLVAFGIAFSIKGNLGTSPVSSLPYVISKISFFTVGTFTICLHVFFISMQIIILRKDYKPIQLFQLAVALCFGFLVDFANYVIRNLTYSNYLTQVIYCLIGIILVGIGVSFEVNAKAVPMAVEGFSLAVSAKTRFSFSQVKITTDLALVLTATILSLVFLGQLEGVREGTFAAAIFVGMVAKITGKVIFKNKD